VPSQPLEEHRLAKLAELRRLGIDPYGSRFEGARPIAELRDAFEEGNPKGVRAAGRIMLLRAMGKATFAHVRDRSGDIQVYFQANRLGEEKFHVHKQLQAGDLVGVEGELGKTRTGEITIFLNDFRVLCKALLSPPEKWHGLRDQDIRYRRRYVDLFANRDVMEGFRTRCRIVNAIRTFLSERGFLEVETPMMQPVAGGAAARPFTTHHNALDIDLYLRVAPELYLKRLLVGGMERVFEINRNFRNEGLDRRHNPEFTALEVYQAYGDYTDMMELAESLIRKLALDADPGGRIAFGSEVIDYASAFRKVRYADAFREANGFPLTDAERVRERAADLQIDPNGVADELLADRVFEATVEEKIVQPTFILDYPAVLSPLTKPRADDPAVAQRWDLFIAGMEIGPAYTELNDPQLQEEKFVQQLAGLDEEDQTLRTVDADFLRALAYGMPPAGGLGLGIDRLIMLLTGREAIREVILFPLLRPEEGLAEEGEG
jgi:lysyl-tRNA synthetase class 2